MFQLNHKSGLAGCIVYENEMKICFIYFHISILSCRWKILCKFSKVKIS